MSQEITMKKLAEMAGVSIGTVDRALNNRKGVKKEVAEQIKSIARAVGYVPNAAGKGLVARKRKLKIAVVICTTRHDYMQELLRGIDFAKENNEGYGVEVIIKKGEDYDVDSQLQMIDESVALGINGLILVPLNDDRITEKIKEVRNKGIFVILTVSDIGDSSIAYVGCNLFKNGKILGGLAFLFGEKNSKILYLSSPLKILGNRERLEGFLAAIKDRGINQDKIDTCELKNDDFEAYRDLTVILAKKEYDTVIITTGCTSGVLKAIEESSLREDVRIIALDLAPEVKVALQSKKICAVVDQHPFLQGKNATEVLFDFIIMGRKPHETKTYIESDVKIFENFF